jgi:hypothetical protein
MTREEIQQALFLEMHKEIEEATAVGLSWFGSTQQGADVTYPPGETLTAEEKAALKNLELSPAARSAVKKIVTDIASAPLFHLFSLMDGVADPESGDFELWLGVDFVNKSLDSDDEGDMLHDGFCSSYWEYKPG